MKKVSKSQSGFTAVEGLLIILILVIIGAVGYMVYHNDHKTNSINTASKTTASSSSNSSKTTTATATNPYAGWKQYCDSVNSYCFKYPANWDFTDKSSQGQGYVTITDPSDSVLLIYNNPYSGDGIDGGSFVSNLIAPLTSNKNLSVIGGYWSDQANGLDEVMYVVVDSSDISPSSATSGTVRLNNNRFTDSGNSGNDGTMTLMPTTTNNELPSTQVNGWLNAKDTQTGVLILKSLSAE